MCHGIKVHLNKITAKFIGLVTKQFLSTIAYIMSISQKFGLNIILPNMFYIKVMMFNKIITCVNIYELNKIFEKLHIYTLMSQKMNKIRDKMTPKMS